MTYFLAAFLRPFVLALIVGLIGYPVTMLIKRLMKEGRLKRLLLKKIY